MLGGLRPGPQGGHWGSPQQLQVSHGHRSCPGRGRQLWPSPHQASASWNVGPADRGPVSLVFAGSWEPGTRCAAGRHSGHRYTTEEWPSPRGRPGAGGDTRPWQRRGTYNEGGAEQPVRGVKADDSDSHATERIKQRNPWLTGRQHRKAADCLPDETLRISTAPDKTFPNLTLNRLSEYGQQTVHLREQELWCGCARAVGQHPGRAANGRGH